MRKCDNCGNKVDLSLPEDAGCLVLRQAGRVVSAICTSCTKDVPLVKLAAVRRGTDEFEYQQYQGCNLGSW